MSYYVEPDYWFAGYAVGDSTGGLVYGAGAVNAVGTPVIAGNYTVGQDAFLIVGTATVLAGGNFTQILPGINLNSKSNMFAAGAATLNSNGAIVKAQSDARMTGRPFWELTTPASGTWVTIVPQAEGTGE